MEFPNVSKLQHFLSCSVIGQYFNADSRLAGNLIQKLFRILGSPLVFCAKMSCSNFRGNKRHTWLPKTAVFPIVWANQLLCTSVPDILAINSQMVNNIYLNTKYLFKCIHINVCGIWRDVRVCRFSPQLLLEITNVYVWFFVSLSSAWVPTHDAFGIVRNCCGIPSAAGSLPACSLFLLHSGVMPLRCVALGKQAHTSDFALRYDNLLRASTSLNMLMDEWKPLQWPRLLCQLWANVTAFFGALCFFPSPLKSKARVRMRLRHSRSFLPFRLQMVWHVSACICLRWITCT